ncbi:MAG: DegV family protein [Candidatus Coproplasma sp.]
MSILLCDSNGELWFDKVKELGMDYISMPYCYCGKEYSYDLGENTDFADFYSAVRAGNVPKTMALNPENYKDILTPYFKAGEDVLYISFSHAMSGTFNQLDAALSELKEQFPERKCTVFDTKSISLGAGIQMLAAAEKKQQGATDEEIVEFLKDFTNKVCVYFSVDDLMHLKRGGRLSAVSAVAGTILSIKPILTLNEKGGLSVFEKASGRRKAIRSLAQKVIDELTDTAYPVYVIDADCKDEGDELAALIKEKRPDANIVRQIIGPVIGTHCGPGTLGIIFIGDKRPIPLEAE